MTSSSIHFSLINISTSDFKVVSISSYVISFISLPMICMILSTYLVDISFLFLSPGVIIVCEFGFLLVFWGWFFLVVFGGGVGVSGELELLFLSFFGAKNFICFHLSWFWCFTLFLRIVFQMIFIILRDFFVVGYEFFSVVEFSVTVGVWFLVYLVSTYIGLVLLVLPRLRGVA